MSSFVISKKYQGDTPGKKRMKQISAKLNDDTLSYYKRIAETLDEHFKSHTLEDQFVDNVFSQLLEEAIMVCQSPEASHIIEHLITVASCQHLKSLLEIFSKDWSGVCRDKCSSHVLQNILLVLPKFIKNNMQQYKPTDDDNVSENIQSIEDGVINILIELFNFLVESMDGGITDIHMSHIYRAVMQTLGGTFVCENVMKSRQSRNYGKHVDEDKQDTDWTRAIKFENYEVAPFFRQLLKSFSKKLFKLADFGVYITDRSANPLIQTLLLVLHKVDLDLCHKYIHRVIKKSRIKDVQTQTNIPPVAVDSVGSFLIELIVCLSSVDLYRELFHKLFKGKLIQYAVHPCANFVLQKLIKSCTDTDIYGEIIEEVSSCLEDIFAAKYFGVLVALAEGCERLICRQDQFLKMLFIALHCWEPEIRRPKFVHLLSALAPFEVIFAKEEESRPINRRFNYHSSLILQHLLKFKNTGLVCSSIQALQPSDLMTISCDPCGSHVIGAIYQSKTVGEKTKDVVFNKLKGMFVDLGCNKNGSRSLDSLWKYLPVKHKSTLAAELCEQENKVRSDVFGRHIYRNFALMHFNKRNKDWLTMQKSEIKKQTWLKAFIEPEEPPAKRRKKKHFAHNS